MQRSRSSRLLRRAGLLLCVVAVLAAVVPAAGYARAALGGHRIDLGDGPRHVALPSGKTFGVYVNDANNSGYSESCSATDVHGRRIEMRQPGWSISSSDTEMLDLVFDTGSGDLTIDCSVPGEQVSIREVPDLHALLIGIALGIVLGLIGFAMTQFGGSKPKADGQPDGRPTPTSSRGRGLLRQRPPAIR